MKATAPDRKWAVVVEGIDDAVGFTALYGVGGTRRPSSARSWATSASAAWGSAARPSG